MWLKFLSQQSVLAAGIYRPLLDKNRIIDAVDVNFFTDSSKSVELGFGGVYDNHSWFFGQWEKGYIKSYDPSIEYLELLALCMAVYAWGKDLKNKRVIVHWDNQSVVAISTILQLSAKIV